MGATAKESSVPKKDDGRLEQSHMLFLGDSPGIWVLREPSFRVFFWAFAIFATFDTLLNSLNLLVYI